MTSGQPWRNKHWFMTRHANIMFLQEVAPIHILSNNWNPLTLCRRRALRATRWRFWCWVFYLVWFVMPKKQTIRKVSHRYQGCSDLGEVLGSQEMLCVRVPFVVLLCGSISWATSLQLRHSIYWLYTCPTGSLYYLYCVLDVTHAFIRAPSIAQLVKNPPAMQETLVQFLGWEDLLKKG